MRLGIVGLGLMGGSLGLAAKKADYFTEIIGYDTLKEHEKQALALHLVDRVCDINELLKSDVMVLAIPAKAAVAFLQSIKSLLPEQAIIDLCSTKSDLVAAVPSQIRANFVAAHPMCGTEYSGPNAAVEGLYEGKTVVICDAKDSGSMQIERAKQLFGSIGMQMVYMSSEQHDKHAAFISHLPHIISFSLANTVLSQEDAESILALAAGGFRDMSRLAKSSPPLWSQIFHQNKQNLLDSIAIFKQEFERLEEAIKKEDFREVEKSLLKGNELYKIFS